MVALLLLGADTFPASRFTSNFFHFLADMQKAFTFKDPNGETLAGILETTDELYRKIIIDEVNLPLLIVKSQYYYHATPQNGETPYALCDTWRNVIPMTEEKRRILVVGDPVGAQTFALALTQGYHENSKIQAVNPFGHPDEFQGRDIHAIDNFAEQIPNTGMAKKIQLYPTQNRIFLPSIKRLIIDIAQVIPTGHLQQDVESMAHIWRKIKTNGYLIFDRVDDSRVQRVINFLLEVQKGHYHILSNQNNQIILRKTEIEKLDVGMNEETHGPLQENPVEDEVDISVQEPLHEDV